ncbi:MAG: hypothetical protein FWG27_03600 [Treponema sp.]|nr:hypothetical protein [Treponema sp.]
MEVDKFVNRLFAWYKTPEGKQWKETLALKLKKSKSKMRQDNTLRQALLELKTDWERQDLLNGLELVEGYLQKYGEPDESGEKFIDLETLGNLMDIGSIG